MPRGTLDADIVADLRPAQVKPLIESLGNDWYFDEQTIRDALEQRSSFNPNAAIGSTPFVTVIAFPGRGGPLGGIV